MILDLDLGNSFLKWRCGAQRGRLAAGDLGAEQLAAAWQGLAPSRVRLASVGADRRAAELAEAVRARWQLPLEIAVSSAHCGALVNSYQDPARMGVDRWLAMLAAFERGPGGCCVVDCGSAITIDYVHADGRHLGGYILPGLGLMRASLLGNTQRVRVGAEVLADTSPGCSTDTAVLHGQQLLLAALAQRVVDDLGRLLGDDARLWITGGDGANFHRHAGAGTLAPDLVLDGLAIALPEVG